MHAVITPANVIPGTPTGLPVWIHGIQIIILGQSMQCVVAVATAAHGATVGIVCLEA